MTADWIIAIMNLGPLLARIDARVTLDRDEGDIAYFHALALQLEYMTKLVTAGAQTLLSEEFRSQLKAED